VKPQYIEDIVLASYEAGQIRGAEWHGLMPVPIPPIYMKFIAEWAKAYSMKHPKMHRQEAMRSYGLGFIDTFTVTAD
jgi:hypothetical protein